MSAKYDRLVDEETLIFAVTEEIARQLDLQRLTQHDLAVRLGVSDTRISRMLSGDSSNLSLRTIARAARALNCNVNVKITRKQGATA